MKKLALLLVAALLSCFALIAYAANEVQHLGPHDFRAAVRFFAPVYLGKGTTTNSGTTVTLPSNGDIVHIAGTTSITNVTVRAAGNCVVLIFDGTLGGSGFVDGNNLKLAGNFAADASDTISMCSDGTNWYEVARSAN
jgi:hypothetical protein